MEMKRNVCVWNGMAWQLAYGVNYAYAVGILVALCNALYSKLNAKLSWAELPEWKSTIIKFLAFHSKENNSN